MSTPFFSRYCEMNINGHVITGPPLTLEFRTDFSVKSSNQGSAVIYNPSKETIGACEKWGTGISPLITIDAGYREDYGTCVIGEISKFEVTRGMDTLLRLTIADSMTHWTGTVVNRSWKGGVKASEVIYELFTLAGITPGKVDIDNDRVYQRGIAFAGVPFRTAMMRLEKDTVSDFFFRHGQGYFLKEGSAAGASYYLSYSSGLLSMEKTGKDTENQYIVKTLFLYQLQPGSLVKIEVPGDYGLMEAKDFKIINGTHNFSTRGESGSEFRVAAI